MSSLLTIIRIAPCNITKSHCFKSALDNILDFFDMNDISTQARDFMHNLLSNTIGMVQKFFLLRIARLFAPFYPLGKKGFLKRILNFFWIPCRFFTCTPDHLQATANNTTALFTRPVQKIPFCC